MAPLSLTPRAETQLFAGGDDAAAVTELTAARHSRHLLQLRALLDAVGEQVPDAAEMAGLDASLAMLSMVQRRDPETVASLLSHPHFGAWAAFCLQRLLGRQQSEIPLWADLAHLGAVAAAAAHRSGLEGDTTVVSREGLVHIPTVGDVRLPVTDRWLLGRAEVRADGIRVVVADLHYTVSRSAGQATPLWQPLRRLRATAGSLTLDLEFDDIGPYRSVYGSPASRAVADTTVVQWRARFAEAWKILVDRHPEQATVIAAGTVSVVPLAPDVRQGHQPGIGVSASSRFASGAVAMSQPTSGRSLASTLVHESRHGVLNLMHDVSPLYQPGSGFVTYSPWRDDPRPIEGLLHGVYAFLGVARFWRTEAAAGGADVRRAEFEYGHAVAQLRLGYRLLSGSELLTPAGHRLVAALGRQLEGVQSRPVALPLRMLVEDLIRHHWIGWQLRNLFALQDATRDLPGNPAYRRLAQTWWTEPTQTARLATRPDLLGAKFPGLDPNDLLLVMGRYPEAAEGFQAQLVQDPHDARARIGLVVARTRLRGGAPLPRPELVRAVCGRLHPVGDRRSPQRV